MKKTTLSIFSICLLSSAVAFAGKVSPTTNNATVLNKPATNSNYTSQLAMFKQMSDAYATKAHLASEQGKTELANAYKKCAEAAGNMIKSLNTGQQNLLKTSELAMQNAVANLKKLKSGASKTVSKKKQSLENLSNSYAKRMAYYEKKAEEAKVKGDEALSKIMSACANAKQEMYQAVNSVINGNKTYTDIVKENENLNLSTDKVDLYQKGVHFQTIALNLQKSAVAISKKANAAKLKGETKMANCYSRMATARQQMAYGYVSYIQGTKDFKNARAELRSYNSSVSSGMVDPKQKKVNLISADINVNPQTVSPQHQNIAPQQQNLSPQHQSIAQQQQFSQGIPNTAGVTESNQLKPQMPQGVVDASKLNTQPTGQPQMPQVNDTIANKDYSQLNNATRMNRAENQLSSSLPSQPYKEPSTTQALNSMGGQTTQPDTVGGATNQGLQVNTSPGATNNEYSQLNNATRMNKAENQLSSKLPSQPYQEPSSSQAFNSMNEPTIPPDTAAGATNQNLQPNTTSMNAQQKNNQAIMQQNDITSPNAVSQVAKDTIEHQNADIQNLDDAMIGSSPSASENKTKTNTANTGSLPQ
ncbi:MAG TPA: hypothetical protein QF753_03305 [Victivallales bacterium]|nr:hypothetical protein [Victivallales bacterium]